MPGTDGAWSTTRFVDIADLRHDMHVNIVNFQPGGAIPFPETHVMEHGLYVLEGKAVYLLNEDWVEVEAGDFMWLRAFCPQACYAGGPGPFRYLLYKDVNRHVGLTSDPPRIQCGGPLFAWTTSGPFPTGPATMSIVDAKECAMAGIVVNGEPVTWTACRCTPTPSTSCAAAG